MSADPDRLFLRATVIGGDRLDNDYQVVWKGLPIGRILQQPGVPEGRPNWAWGVIIPSKPQRPTHRGLCSDLAECKRHFRVVWKAIRPTLTGEDIDALRHKERRGG
jgi:hypothetical protein